MIQPALRWVGCLVFTVSGTAKLWDLQRFSQTVAGYGVVPETLSTWVAASICLVEILLGVTLLLDSWVRVSGYVLLTMTVGFTIFSTWNLSKGRISDCGCFGTLLSRENDIWLVVENASICALLVSIVFIRGYYKTRGGN
jgi:uncharacterized membrane protein YphA (DoxX/SURF4 family)